MDIPLPRRKTTWRDSAWWQATWQSLISAALMMILAAPLLLYLVNQLMRLSRLHVETSAILSNLAEGTLLMLPYLWVYFFILEHIARQKSFEFPPSVHDR
jgi:hypothetical protein